jgi:hypothetical protein
VVVGLATMTVHLLGDRMLDVSVEATQSGATCALIALGLWALAELARPLDAVRVALVAILAAMGVGAINVPFVAHLFQVEIPSGEYLAWIAAVVAVGCVMISVALRLFDRFAERGEPPIASTYAPGAVATAGDGEQTA